MKNQVAKKIANFKIQNVTETGTKGEKLKDTFFFSGKKLLESHWNPKLNNKYHFLISFKFLRLTFENLNYPI